MSTANTFKLHRWTKPTNKEGQLRKVFIGAAISSKNNKRRHQPVSLQKLTFTKENENGNEQDNK
jgi:hypothetical protein